VSPEKCHYHAGTCREPEWGEAHCMIDHFVYLANTSGLKVGITRGTQVPTRWIDQGATQALPVFRVASRLDSGTGRSGCLHNTWPTRPPGRPCSRGRATPGPCSGAPAADGTEWRARSGLREERGLDPITELDNGDVTTIDYPVLEYPSKVKSMTFDKLPEVGGALWVSRGST
jgi:hypothetical protein